MALHARLNIFVIVLDELKLPDGDTVYKVAMPNNVIELVWGKDLIMV